MLLLCILLESPRAGRYESQWRGTLRRDAEELARLYRAGELATWVPQPRPVTAVLVSTRLRCPRSTLSRMVMVPG